MAQKSLQQYPSFQEYHRFLKNEKSVYEKGALTSLASLSAFNHSLIAMLPGASYILNYKEKRYHFVSSTVKDVIGYSAEEFIEKGNDYYLTLLHPEDLKVYTSDIFRQFLAKTQELNKHQLQHTRFSINYRIRRKDNQYVHVLQQYKIVDFTKDGFPLVAVGYICDISSIKSSTKIVLSATTNVPEQAVREIRVESESEKKFPLSKRETEIIHFLIKGLSSKQIAAKLGISLFTVNAHRRNILSKTNCTNTAEIVYYALENGIG